jgi:hypothetical protein
MEPRCRCGLHVAVQSDGAIVSYEAAGPAPRVQSKTTGKGVLVGVEAHELLGRRTGHTHGAIVKLLEAFFTQKELGYDHSNPDPHDR